MQVCIQNTGCQMRLPNSVNASVFYQTRRQQLVPKTVKSTVEVQSVSQDVQIATYGHWRVDADVTSLTTQDGATR
jgi:hypothetical protein